MSASTGAAEALVTYSAASDSSVARCIVDNGAPTIDQKNADGFAPWLSECDPITGGGARPPSAEPRH